MRFTICKAEIQNCRYEKENIAFREFELIDLKKQCLNTCIQNNQFFTCLNLSN